METNRSGEMEVFVKAVDARGFSAAARALGMTPSAVSKSISRLEARLGARLVHRSTRTMQLTAEGATFYERSARVLSDLDAAEREISAGRTPDGRLRVNSNVPFGMHCLVPLLPAFLARYPQITVDLVLTDTVVDIVASRADVAIRTGPLKASRLVARKLGSSRMIVVAAPKYLERHGTPRKPADLANHNCISLCAARHARPWTFGRGRTHLPSGNAVVGDGETMRQLALAGVGIARLAEFHIGSELATGRLVPLLVTHDARETEPVHAVFVGHAGKMPARVRAFIDYLAAADYGPALSRS